jgi:hypothetical protein
VARSVCRVQGLPPEDVDHALIELDDATCREVERLLCGASERRCRRGDIIEWCKALVFDDSIGIVEIANEVDYCAPLFSDEVAKASSQLLEEDTLGLRGTKEEQTLSKGQIDAFIQKVHDAKDLDLT